MSDELETSEIGKAAEAAESFDPSTDIEALPEPNTDAVEAERAKTEAAAPSESTDDLGTDSKRAVETSGDYESGNYRVICQSGKWINPAIGTEYKCANGFTFDPAYHENAPNKNGPAISKRGYIRRKRGVKPDSKREPAAPSPSADASQSSLPPIDGPTQPDSATPPSAGSPSLNSGIGSALNDLRASQMAQIIVGSLASVGVQVAGPEAAMRNEEKNSIRLAWEAYLQTIDCSVIPPWLMPVVATGPYVQRCAAIVVEKKTLENRAKQAKKESESPEPTGTMGPVGDAEPIHSSPVSALDV